MTGDLKRRDVLKLFSAAALTAPLALTAPDPDAPLYFTKDEFALLDTLTELIIPADDHSPGAHDAGVAKYIDKSVAEAFLPEDKSSWRKGLASINDLSRSAHDKPFLQTTKAQQVALLENMAASGPEHAGRRNRGQHDKFFAQLKETTAFAYYSSKIGIHQEIEYKGNVVLQEYAGYLPTDQLPPVSSL